MMRGGQYETLSLLYSQIRWVLVDAFSDKLDKFCPSISNNAHFTPPIAHYGARKAFAATQLAI